MATSSYSNLERIRRYGEYQFLAFSSPEQRYKVDFRLPPHEGNYESMALTIDTNHCDNWRDLVERLVGYGVSDLLLTEPPRDGAGTSLVPTMSFRLQEGRGTGHFSHGTSKAKWDLSGTKSYWERKLGGSNDPSTLSEVTVHAIAESHEILNRNLMVVDNPERRGTMLRLAPHLKSRLASSSEAVEFALRTARNLGLYYVAPSETVSKGRYYRDLLYTRVPAYERLWSIAVYGTHEKIIDRPLYDLAESLGDRLLAFSRLADQIIDASFEQPDREALWDVVNSLNYFFVLQTGILDNLAWLCVARHGLVTAQKSIVLRYPLKHGNKVPGPLHHSLKVINNELFDLIDGFQPTLEVFYPIRDAVQHRLILKGAVIKYIDEGWVKVMVFPEPETVAALLHLEETRTHRINSWGLLVIDQGLCVLDPRTFVKKALSQTEAFVERFLHLLHPEQLLQDHPEVLARARA